MKKTKIIIFALTIVTIITAISLTGCGGKKITFIDEPFKNIVAEAFDKDADKITEEDLGKIVGIDLYYYAERIGDGTQYKNQWSVTLLKEGYHAAYKTYYDAPVEERANLTKPSDYAYNGKIDDFTGYEDLRKFNSIKKMSFSSEYTTIMMNPLVFITHMKNLEELSVYNYVISDLNIISMFKNLKDLSIGINLRQIPEGETIEYIKDVSPIKELTRLETLSLSGTSISDLSPLVALKNLKSLSCTTASLSDISPVSKIKTLEFVNFYFNGISDVTPLTKLPKLKTAYLDYNYISDVSPFANLDADTIEYVSLDMNTIDDLTPLKHLGKEKVYVGYDIYWD